LYKNIQALNILNWKRSKHGMYRFSIKATWSEEPIKIKEEVWYFFNKGFEESETIDIKLKGISFSSLSSHENVK